MLALNGYSVYNGTNDPLEQILTQYAALCTMYD